MYWQTKIFTWLAAIVGELLGALLTRPAGALLTTPTVVLYSAGPTPGTSSDIGDYTVTDFSGYADVVPVFGGPLNLPSGGVGLLGSALFTADDTLPFVSDDAVGYLITNGTTGIYGGEVFDVPKTFGREGDFLVVEAMLPLIGVVITGQ